MKVYVHPYGNGNGKSGFVQHIATKSLMRCASREQPSFQAAIEGRTDSPAVHEGHQAKSSRLSDPAQRMFGSQQWRAGVVAPPSVDVWLT